MAIAAIPHGKCSRAALGHRPRLRIIFRVGIGRGRYHGAGLLILNGVLHARAAIRSSGSKNAQPRRIYNKSVLFAQPYLDRTRNSAGHGSFG
jgi:hypothetical protein